MRNASEVKGSDFMSKKKRSGMDDLSLFLITIAFIAAIIMIFLSLHRFIFLTWILIIIAYWRSFSKNKAKRSKENQTFTEVNPFIKNIPRDAYHTFFNCKKCAQLLRIPKKTGHIKVTCPRCNHKFVKKTIRGRVKFLK